LKRKDWDTFAAGLAEDQIEVEPTGVYDKAGTLAAVKTVDFTRMTLSDFKETKFDDDATLVTYTVKGPGPDGKPMEERASSIWVKRGEKWLAVFHHGTPVMKMPAK
ncbi:MAG TPA: nuclear transport factor 2 family protein, partial [Pyrinomonadaceae bacterium]